MNSVRVSSLTETYLLRLTLAKFAAMIWLLSAHASSGNAAEPQLTRIENSPGLSQLIGINKHGQAIGTKEVADEVGFSQQPFFLDGQRETPIPLVVGYTNLQPLALSDDGKVVGYVSRYSQQRTGDLRAFVWDSTSGETQVLLPPDDLDVSHAFDISADGTVVVGYVTGADPPRMLPCVWMRKSTGWLPTILPTIYEYNPFLLSSGVVVSSDGGHVAACLAVDIVKDELLEHHIHHLFQWDSTPQGTWQRQKLREHAAKLGDINDRGTVVGSCLVNRDRRAFVLSSDHEFQVLPLFDGDQTSEALDVNNDDLVVGYSDDPAGPDGGPVAFVWQVSEGKLKPLKFPPDVLFSTANTVADDGTIGGYLVPQPPSEGPAAEKTVSFILADGY